MTFEEWKEKHSDLIENVAITFFNYERGVNTKTCFDELEYILKRAFKAGKNMNAPTKWHDLRKDPNDLPVRMCIDNDGNVVRLFRNSWDKKSTWYRYDFHEREWWQMETEPIAWCEIPKFEEK